MFEDRTYEYIMSELINKVPVDVSTEEGSIIQSALSPLAYELEKLYIEFDVLLSQTFVETADYDYLEKRAAERGLTPIAATYCQSLGIFNVEIPIGSRFLIGDLYFVSGESYVAESGFGYVMTCETVGTVANGVLGALTLIEAGSEEFDIGSLTSAVLSRVLIPARDKEEKNDFLKRYFDSFNTQAFGGNVSDYMEKIAAISGVGGIHIYPVWNGAGTVKAVILGSDYLPASEALVAKVKNTMDPDDGLGAGLAPIGHVLTAASAEGISITVSATITPIGEEITDDTKAAVKEAVEEYLLELRKDWQEDYVVNGSGITVRLAEVESRILNAEGVLDVADTKINGSSANLALSDDAVPVLSEVVV